MLSLFLGNQACNKHLRLHVMPIFSPFCVKFLVYVSDLFKDNFAGSLDEEGDVNSFW